MLFKYKAKLLSLGPSFHLARWSTDSWTWEMLSCTFSVVTTLAVASILLMFDDKSLPKLPYNIGLNSVVSILGTMSKSALLLVITSSISQFKWLDFDHAFKSGTLQDLELHDEASRGPWGSFMLLFHQKRLSWAKIGALVTILSLAFDPMYQALIAIEQRPRNQYYPIAIAKRAQGFDDPSSLLSNTSILETNPSCPTGNCSFSLISSLGFCSNCVDITQSLQRSSECTERPVDRAGNENERVIDCNYWLPPSSSGLNYSDSNYGELRNGSLNLSWERISADLFGPSFLTIFLSHVEDSSELVERFQSPFALQNGHVIPSSLAKIALSKTAPLTSSLSAGFVGTAHICALSVCARQYSVWMTSSFLLTEIISTLYGNLTWQPNLDHIFLYTFNNSAFEASEPAAMVQEDIVDEFNFTSGMFDALSGILEGNVTFSDSPSLSRPATSMLQYGLNASSNITATMERVATAMTNTLRDTSNLTVPGKSESMELYIRISWPWLALPVLSVILETILLISVITVTRKHRLPIWKTSELALLFHGLDFSLDDGIKRHQVSEMEEAATTLRVRLGRGPRGDLQLQRVRLLQRKLDCYNEN